MFNQDIPLRSIGARCLLADLNTVFPQRFGTCRYLRGEGHCGSPIDRLHSIAKLLSCIWIRHGWNRIQLIQRFGQFSIVVRRMHPECFDSHQPLMHPRRSLPPNCSAPLPATVTMQHAHSIIRRFETMTTQARIFLVMVAQKPCQPKLHQIDATSRCLSQAFLVNFFQTSHLAPRDEPSRSNVVEVNGLQLVTFARSYGIVTAA